MVQLLSFSELTNVNSNIDWCFRFINLWSAQKVCHSSYQGHNKQNWKEIQLQKETLIRFEGKLYPKYSW